MEWPFTFQTGSGKTAVIQLCADINTCYVFHVYEFKKIPAVLVALLKHDKVILHGVNIKKYGSIVIIGLQLHYLLQSFYLRYFRVFYMAWIRHC